MSFHEKSAWACLIPIVAVYVPYFWVVFQYPIAFGLFAVAAIILAVLLAAFHIVNALATRSIRKTGDVPPFDELDRTIELRAAKLSGIVLAVAVMVWCTIAMFGVLAVGVSEVVHAEVAGDAATPSGFVVPVMLALTAIHALFAGFVIANIAYYGSIVAGYRRLAHG